MIDIFKYNISEETVRQVLKDQGYYEDLKNPPNNTITKEDDEEGFFN